MNSTSNLILPRTWEARSSLFRFDEPTHVYWLGEKKLPGITGILQACRYVDTKWYTAEARNRGSHVHLGIKFLNKGTLDWTTVLDEYLGYILAYQKLVRDWQIEVEYFERPMYHPELLFGGTPDIICRVLGGIPAIVELKTGPVMPWTALQTIGQELLDRAWSPEPIRRRRWGVTLNADGTYTKPKEFKDYERDEAVFRMLNTVVQTLGKEKTTMVFDVLGSLNSDEREALQELVPTLNSVVGHRELYAA